MKIRVACWLVLSLFLHSRGYSADLIEVLPATNRILVVFFNEGHIDYAGLEEGNDSTPNAPLYKVENKVYYSHLRISGAAENASSYSITSKDDAVYLKGKAPLRVGRKAKGIDFNFPDAKPQFLLGHWVYLELPEPLQSGKSYTVTTGRLAANTIQATLTFDERRLRSDTIHVNQVGFAPGAPKVAYLSHWMGTMGGLNLDAWSDSPFQLLRLPERSAAFTGRVRKRMSADVAESRHDDFGATKNYSLADVWECDFGPFRSPGEYVVSVGGIGCSYPYEIGDEVVREPFYYAMKGLFYQRQGIVKHIEGDRIYPRDFFGFSTYQQQHFDFSRI